MQIGGGDKLARYLTEASKKATSAAEVSVGWFEDSSYPDGTSVAMVAALNEFGHGKTPARPAFRNMVAAKSGGWGSMVGQLLDANHGDAGKTLGQMGEVISADLKDSIVEGSYAPNSPVTNLLKQRFPTRDGMTAADVWRAFSDVARGGEDANAPAGKPLVWSGTELNSIGSRVT